MVTLDPPEFVSVSVKDLKLPTVTLPKPNEVGFAANVPGATPVPLSAIFNGEFDASEMMARVPLTAPAAVGANFAENVTVCNGVKVTGSVKPVMEKPAPVTIACEIVTFTPPVLVKTSDSVAVLPVV